MEYRGRQDHQVKLRGYRIELGEIEAVLGLHPAIETSVVLVHENGHGDQRLVAYIVPERGASSLTLNDVRSYLQNHLPEYMLPSQIVLLESLPLTPNGKINRRAVLSLEVDDAAISATTAMPRTPIEEILVEIWGDILGSSVTGIHDNFFAIGGHSLLATRLISRVRTVFQTELPLRSLFQAPTIAEFSPLVEQALLNKGEQQIPPLLPVSRTQPLPLSFTQQRLWFLDQLKPESTAYLMFGHCWLQGRLDVEALEHSLATVVQRHESLRTVFIAVDGQPEQVIKPHLTLPLPVVDLSALPVKRQKSETHRLVQENARRPFDLTRGPLLRIGILRLGEQQHALLQTMHHIISDGWSMENFTRELTTLYDAFKEEKPSPLSPLPIQYPDFAVWQRKWLQGEVVEKKLDYWKRQLAGSEPLNLPTDRPRPAMQTTRGAHQSFQLPPEITRCLKALCQREGVTLFMLLLAAFQVLLARYTEQEDIAVGTSIANRDRSELEGLIGFFVNTLVMRTDLSGNPTFLELLKRVRDVTLGAYAHQDLPVEKIIEALQLERDTSRSPLFQVMLLMQNTPTENKELAGLTVQPLSMENHTAKFDLTLSVRDVSRGLRGVLEYNTDLFDASTIARMLEHWQSLLESIATHPEWPIADLTLLTDAELHQVLSAWSGNMVDIRPCSYHQQNLHFSPPHQVDGSEVRQPQSVHEHFDLQVQRAPDAVAVVHAEHHLTYQSLNQRSNQLARYLYSLGVCSEVPVGIFLERSMEMLIAVLGVLKAGGAYLPLEPATPTERIAVILADCQPLLLLTSSHLHTRIPDGQTQLVKLDVVWQTIVQQRSDDLGLLSNANDLAYVISTSGSTGTPKGVLIEHQSLLNVTLNACDTYQLTSADRLLQFASLSFDTAAEEIYPCLLTGATLIIRPETMLDSLQGFARYSEVSGLTILDLPTAYWHLLVTELSSGSLCLPETLRLTIIGGEKAQREQLELWKRIVPARIRLVNTYGPTETTIVATLCDLGVAESSSGVEVPIGRAMRSVQTYILDRHLHPVPIGVPGQLYLGGVGLARGYLHRPDLTARSFIPHPWSKREGARLYATGDRVRWRRDGQIEYLGRTDRQVKLRGYRIELGEIEAVLLCHPQVQDCLVLIQEDQAGQRYLLAYLVTDAPTSQLKEELYRYGQGKLPHYMLPSDFIFLDQFPLTANGKVDHHALARQNWIQLQPELEKKPVLPRTPVEEVLVVIWKELLGRQSIGLHENFFHLGGHSLLAVQVVARIRTHFQIDLPLRILFEAPTVAELSRHVEQARQDKRGIEVPPLQPAARGQELPLSFAQQRLWFLDQLEANSTAYTIPFSVIVEGKLDIAALDASLQEVIRRHESLRTTYHSDGGRPHQVIAEHMTLPLPVADLQNSVESMRMTLARRILQEETLKPFDLQRGPLIRVWLLRLQPQEHVVTIMMHHIVSDAWSVGVFMREITMLYTAFTQNKPSPLPPLPIQYADFALWQHQYLQKKTLQAHLDYWRKQLAGAKALELPTDHPRPEAQNYRGASYPFALPAHLTSALTSLSQQEGVTTFMTLLAAFQTLLYRMSGQTDIVLGTDMAGRNHVETEPLIGFFVNLLVLRTDLSGMPTFRMVLRRVREVVLDAYTYQDMPFEMLVEHLRLERHGNRTPLINLLFVMQNVPLTSERLSNLTFKPFQSEVTTAKFDLALFVHESPDGLRGTVNYSTDLFGQRTIATLVSRFQQILQQSVLNYDTIIDILNIYGEDEIEQLKQNKQKERAARSNKMRRSKGKEINLT
jgi:amino acid adenylation domain-containing protein